MRRPGAGSTDSSISEHQPYTRRCLLLLCQHRSDRKRKCRDDQRTLLRDLEAVQESIVADGGTEGLLHQLQYTNCMQ